MNDDELREADLKVMERRVRERRRRDKWGKRFERGCLLLLVVLYFVGFQSDHAERKHRIHDSAQSSLVNCMQVEEVKTALRHDADDQVARTVAFAKKNDLSFGDLSERQVIRATEKQASERKARFAPIDCYSLPIVQAAGLRRGHSG